jgi:hypothetical protein
MDVWQLYPDCHYFITENSLVWHFDGQLIAAVSAIVSLFSARYVTHRSANKGMTFG